MRIFIYEIQKLMQRRVTWLIVAALLVVNGIFVFYETKDSSEGYPLSAVEAVYGDLTAVSEENRESWLEDRISWLNTQLSWIGLSQLFDEEVLQELLGEADTSGEYPYTMYTETWEQEIALLSDVAEQALTAAVYEEYLAYVESQVSRYTQSSLFSDPTSYSYRNMVKMGKVYGSMQGTVITPSSSAGVMLVTNFRLTDVFLILSVWALLLNVFLAEREEGTLALIRTTKKGRLSTAGGKAALMLLLSAALTLCYYGTNLVISSSCVGLGDLQRSIQSLDGYISSPFALTVGQYLVLFFLVKMASVCVLSALLFFLCEMLRSTMFTLVLGVGILAAELLIWTRISYTSWLYLLRAFNLLTLLDTETYFSTYTNIAIFQRPVNTLVCGIGFGVLLFGFCLFFGIRSFCLTRNRRCRVWEMLLHRTRADQRRKSEKNPSLSLERHIRTGGFGHESWKLFFAHKGIWLLLLLVVVQYYCYKDAVFYSTAEEYYYRAYSDVLEGELTEDKQSYLEEILAEYAAVDLELLELEEQYAAGEISEVYYTARINVLQSNESKRNAFERAWDQYAYLMEEANQGVEVEYICQTGWTEVLGVNGQKRGILDAAKLFFVLILAFAAAQAYEFSTGMDVLIRISACGWRRTRRRKRCYSCLYGAAAAMVAFVPALITPWKYYHLQLSGASVHSILMLDMLPGGLSLTGWLLILVLALVGLSIGIVQLVLWVSEGLKKLVPTVLSCAAVCYVPVLLLYWRY